MTAQRDSIWNHYQDKINVYEEQKNKIYSSTVSGRISTRFKVDLDKYEQYIKDFENERNTRITTLEAEFESSGQSTKNKNQSNTLALIVITLFMEFIILLGVGFNAYYLLTSYNDMKRTMSSPTYQKMLHNLQLLHLFYQNGNKKEGEHTVPITKFRSLVTNSGIEVKGKDVTDFINMCTEMNIIKGNRLNKFYSMDYDKAKEIIESGVR